MAEPTVDDILRRVDLRREAMDLSDREVSIRATGKPDAVREMRRGKRPSDMRVRQLAEALGVSPGYLRGEDEETDPRITVPTKRTVVGRISIDLGLRPIRDMLPIYGAETAQKASDRPPGRRKKADQPQVLLVNTEKSPSTFPRPVTVPAGTNIFAIEVCAWGVGNPYGFGEIAVIDPDADPEAGQDVLIRLRPAPGDLPYEWHVILQHLHRIDRTHLEVSQPGQLSPIYRIARDEITSAFLILSPRKLLTGF